LVQILKDNFNDIKISETDTINNLMQLLGIDNWHLLIIGPIMVSIRGLDPIRQIKDSDLDLHILMFSSLIEDQIIISTIKTGSSGYLGRDCTTEELVSAAAKLIMGGRYLSEELAEKIIQNKDNWLLHDNLSRREYQVFHKLYRATQ
jgi:two-component system, NarL family, invasion response regulator UvrY